ncbi:uncharacterized protein LOC142570929 [Dermacentor variabilis]|uniref:uncharacterized protein LOC142570929 n=1 Tax=Dermacentor variabilis TaxID=34621 RepID=UPI003F5C12BE
MAAESSSASHTATNCGDAACLRPSTSTTAGTGGLRPRAVRYRARAGGPTAAEMPPPPPRRRVPVPLLEEAHPPGTAKMKERLQELVESILLFAMSSAIVLIAAAVVSHLTGCHQAVGLSMLAASIVIDVASFVVYVSSRHERTREQLAVVLLPIQSSLWRSRCVPNDDDRDHAGSRRGVGDVWHGSIV